MTDILLNSDGDLNLTENGDIQLTKSVRQAIRIRLLWFFNEWQFAPELGIPYFEDILIKKTNMNRIRRIIRNEVMGVGVRDVQNIGIDVKNRRAAISFTAVTDEETYREELLIFTD